METTWRGVRSWNYVWGIEPRRRWQRGREVSARMILGHSVEIFLQQIWFENFASSNNMGAVACLRGSRHFYVISVSKQDGNFLQIAVH